MKRSFFKFVLLAIAIITLFNVTGYCDSEVPQVDFPSVISKKGGGSVSVHLDNSATVYLDKGIVEVVYKNQKSSNQDSVITLYIIKDGKEYAVACSELVKVGNEIQTLKLLEDRINLMQGVYTGRYIIEHYSPETGEKAVVTAKFNNIEVIVK